MDQELQLSSASINWIVQPSNIFKFLIISPSVHTTIILAELQKGHMAQMICWKRGPPSTSSLQSYWQNHVAWSGGGIDIGLGLQHNGWKHHLLTSFSILILEELVVSGLSRCGRWLSSGYLARIPLAIGCASVMLTRWGGRGSSRRDMPRQAQTHLIPEQLKKKCCQALQPETQSTEAAEITVF